MKLSDKGKVNGAERGIHVDVDTSGMVPFSGRMIKLYWADSHAAHSLEVPFDFLKAIVRLSG